jgi:hypothetical protein
MRRKIEILFFNPSNGITLSEKMSEQQNQTYMSVFIPYIANYSRDDLRLIIEQMNIGTISRIDISTRRDRPSNMAFVHFREWNDANPLTKQVKYEMETYEQWSIDVPLDIANPDLSTNNYFTLNLRINKNPIPPTTMTIETLSDGLMRALDLVETLQKKCDYLLDIGNEHNDMIEQLTDELLQSQSENAELKERLLQAENNMQNIENRLLYTEKHVDTLNCLYFDKWSPTQLIKKPEPLVKPQLERQTNCPQYPDSFPTRSTHIIEDELSEPFNPDEITLTNDEYEEDFDPRIYGDYTGDFA